ncbi:MAG: hypothetical protein ACE5JD_12935, partial [Candidatus Methylomirabilia bacterium]
MERMPRVSMAPWRDERGIALVLALMALVIMAALSAALLTVGRSEVQITSNLLSGTQALFAAEAGAERGIVQFVATPSLVNLAPTTCPTPDFSPLTVGGGSAAVTYACDGGFATVRIDSTGSTSVGNAQRSARVVVTTAFVSNFALLGNSIEVDGNGSVQGTTGAVHGNAETDLSGSASVAQTATSSSSDCDGCTDSRYVGVPAASGGNQPAESIPSVSPLDFLSRADYVFGDGSTVVNGITVPEAQILIVATGTLVNENSGIFQGW